MNKTLAALATVAILAAGAASAAPVHINFAGSPSQSGPSLTFGDVTITGSDTVFLLQNNSLGIVNTVVNNGESITFSFDQMVDNVIISIGNSGRNTQANPLPLLGQRTVEVFGATGNLLGSVVQGSPGEFDISAIAGGQSLSYFTMTSDLNTSFSITQLRYELAPLPEPETPAPIPLPAGAPLLLGALGALALIRRRAKKAA